MADVTAPRITKQMLNNRARKHVGIEVATGTLYHGTIGGLDASSLAAKPGAGVYPLGRVICANGVSATSPEKVDIEEGSFSWDLDSGETLPAIGALVYAKDNHTVSVNAGEGQAFATYEGVFPDDQGNDVAFYMSGYGHRVDAT